MYESIHINQEDHKILRMARWNDKTKRESHDDVVIF